MLSGTLGRILRVLSLLLVVAAVLDVAWLLGAPLQFLPLSPRGILSGYLIHMVFFSSYKGTSHVRLLLTLMTSS